MATESKVLAGVLALRNHLHGYTQEFLEALSAAVLDSVEERCVSRSPVHGIQCELKLHDDKLHTAGAYSWAGGSVYALGATP